MRTGTIRVQAVALLAAFMLAFTAGSAAAAVYKRSDYGYYSTNGINYRNDATLNGSGTGTYIWAATSAGPTNTSAPAGWIGSNGRLFTSGGSLTCQTGYKYSTSSTSTAAVFSSGASCARTKGTWQSYGVSKAWTGSVYNAYFTFKSPLHSN